MGQARGPDGAIYETDANGDAIRMISPAPAQGHIFTLPQSPEKLREIARQQATDARVNRAADRADVEWNAKHNPDGTDKAEPTAPPLGDPAKHGPEYLASLPENVRNRVQQMLDGRTILSAREKGMKAAPGQASGQQLMDAANQADPNFDESASMARWKARQAFTSEGKGSQQVQAAERLSQHAMEAYRASKDLGGPDLGLTPLSSIANAITKATRQKQVAAYQVPLIAIAGEFQKLTKNGTATVDETKHIMDQLAPGNPEDVRLEGLRAISQLAKAQVGPTRQAWESAWQGSKAPPMPMDFSPDSLKMLDTIEQGGDPVKVDINGRIIGGVGGNGITPGGGAGGSAPHYGDGGGGNIPGGPDQSIGASGGYRSEHSARMDSMVNSMVNAGAGMASINAALNKASFPPLDAKTFNAAKKWMAETGKPYFAANITRNVPLNLGQQIAGSAIGSGLAHMADAATAGTVGALAGEQGRGALDAMAALHPDASVTGDVVGGVTGAGLGEAAAARAAPAAMAKYAPRIADALYGGLSGFNAASDGQGGAGAAKGALGGVLGGYLGGKALSAVGKGLRGVSDPAVQYLHSLNIPLTVGQAVGNGGLLGKGVKMGEDALTSVLGAGGQVAARRREGLQEFAKNVGQQAVDPINGVGPGYGEAAAQDMMRQGGAAYDSATAGVHVPLDAQALGQLGDARALGGTLPDDLAARFGKALDNRVAPIQDAGALTGETYQQAMRGLKSYRAEAPKPGFEQDYRDALSGVMGTLKGQMMRGGGDQVVHDLGQADQAWKNIKVFQKATEAARNGTGGDLGLPLPSQFNNAAQQAANKFGGPRPMADLIDAGQSVLPSKLPDSGTALRAAVTGTLLGGGLAGGGYGIDGGEGAGLGLGGVLLLAAGGSKTAQHLATKALLDRPDLAITLGNKLVGSRYGGMLGAAAGTRLPPFSVSP